MPLIRVVYRAEENTFDYVPSDLLDTLITQDKITHFFRPSERRWISTRLDPVRGSAEWYHGPERRKKVNKPGPIEEKGGLNAEASCSGWLEGLWRFLEKPDALG
jgi:hypothetical protein